MIIYFNSWKGLIDFPWLQLKINLTLKTICSNGFTLKNILLFILWSQRLLCSVGKVLLEKYFTILVSLFVTFHFIFFPLTSVSQYIKTIVRSKWPNLTKLSWKHMNENLNSWSPSPFPDVFGSVAVWYFEECHSHGRICPNRKL